jgi:predicted  nucleic acid-binding Zn-ribbon protein
MLEERTDDLIGRRLALYAYLEPLLSGRRVLEIEARQGRGAVPAGESTQYLRSLGARVVTVDRDATVDDRFDVVVVPEADELARRPEAFGTIRKLLVEGGRAIIATSNADRGGAKGAGDGVGYYELYGAVAAHFGHVQMLGVTPFLGMGIVEFEGAVDGLRIDSRLVKEGSEPPAAYVAVAGTHAAPALGYALVQLPFAPIESRLASGAGAPVPSGALLREEIDELRGRLRRAAEDRAALDAEVTTLRRALTEADAAVVSLTRKTTDEMSAMAERLAAGLRHAVPPDARASGADVSAARDEADRLRARLAEAEARAAAAEQRLEEMGGIARQRLAELEEARERLALADAELARARRSAARSEDEAKAAAASAHAVAERDRALAGRDERIARLESEKQDLVWRLAELEDKLTATIARAVRADTARGGTGQPEASAPAGAASHAADRDEGRLVRERALDEFHKAATAHVDEITALNASVAEQAALVAELEDAVQSAEARAAASEADATTLRKTAKALEEADRSRRSRLAELEGKLLRLEHERKSTPPAAAIDDERAAWARERAELRAEIQKLAQQARGHNGHHETTAQRLDQMAAGVAAAASSDDPVASRLENTLGNYRQRATRLRDELEGVRRRFDALSPSEIAGFLEELGEDLSELGK